MQISKTTYERVKHQYACVPRQVELKGLGLDTAYIVLGDTKAGDWLVARNSPRHRKSPRAGSQSPSPMHSPGRSPTTHSPSLSPRGGSCSPRARRAHQPSPSPRPHLQAPTWDW